MHKHFLKHLAARLEIVIFIATHMPRKTPAKLLCSNIALPLWGLGLKKQDSVENDASK